MTMLARLRPFVVALLMLALGPIPAAWAHAQLLSTAPAQNAVLPTAPVSVALTFNEPVNPLSFRLIGPDGKSVDVTATGGATVPVMLPPDLPRGTHVLAYRVVSTDGHPIAGSLIFSIGAATGAAAAPVGDPAVGLALWAGKAVFFLAMFIGIGGSVFLVIGEVPRRARLASRALSLFGVFAAAATIGLQSLDALGLPLGDLFVPAGWAAAFATSYGMTAVAAGIAFLAAFVALSLPPGRAAAGLGVVAGALVALSLALSGHASAATPQWLTRPAVFLHIAGVLFWVGALLPLGLLLRDRSMAADRALSRFSRAIPFAVAPLVLSGMVLAAVQLGLPGPQWLTGYGVILAAKLGLLVALFALAVWNRRMLTRPVLEGDDLARRRLRKSIRAETVLVVIILALVAGWRFTPPPRALAEAAAAQAVEAEPLMLHLADDTTMAMAMVSPGAPGPGSLEITLSDLEGFPTPAQSIAVILSSPQLGVEPIRHEAVEAPELGEGIWRIADFTIPLAGTWQMEMDIRVSRFTLTKLGTEFAFPAEPWNPEDAKASPSVVLGALTISGGFLRATLPKAPVGGAYLTITNTGTADDRLVSASSPAAGSTTLHEMELTNDIMRMRAVSGGMLIPAGGSLVLEPGSQHLMLNQLAAPLVEGDSIPITLTFEKAGSLTVDMPVGGFGATSPP